jgi:hypothetical protein
VACTSTTSHASFSVDSNEAGVETLTSPQFPS